MQVNGYSENSPSFGMHYSKKTIKALKRIVPELIKNEGFENTRLAIGNLTKLGKRKDGLITQLVNDGPYWSIEPAVRPAAKDSAFKYFIYPSTPSCCFFVNHSHSGFLDFTKSLASDDFVKAANKEIDGHTKYLKSQTFEDRVRARVEGTKEALEDAVDWLQDKFSIIDGTTFPDGTRFRTTLVMFDDMKNAFRSFWKRANEPYNHEVAFLRKEIDNLPTK
jgi:hypothetical protein